MSVLYYYCKMDTFKSMLKTKTLWLTDLTRSNDSEEVIRAYRNLWERIRVRLDQTDIDKELLASQFEMLDSAFQVQSLVDIPFGCCFCSENDLVQQWREYGDNGCGVAVGFDLDAIPGLVQQHPITSADITHAIGYEKVIYDSEQLELDISRICYDAMRLYGNHAWLMAILPTFKHYAGFIKNPTFRDEKEIRIVFYPNDNFVNTMEGLSELETRVVPHYCLSWFNKGTSALRNITIGYENGAKKEEIAKLLNDAGITDDIPIYRSECSYRNRLHTKS